MDTKPDIICLNETKLHQEAANLLLTLNGYSTHHRSRNTVGGGGGVAIIVAHHLDHTLVNLPLQSDTEAIAITLSCANTSRPLTIATLYNPPSSSTEYHNSRKSFHHTKDQRSKKTKPTGTHHQADTRAQNCPQPCRTQPVSTPSIQQAHDPPARANQCTQKCTMGLFYRQPRPASLLNTTLLAQNQPNAQRSEKQEQQRQTHQARRYECEER
jgi:hypothetical protein